MVEATPAYLSENSPAMLVLEGIVDRTGLRNVLFALEHICFAKANHLEENWQDLKSAPRSGRAMVASAALLPARWAESAKP